MTNNDCERIRKDNYALAFHILGNHDDTEDCIQDSLLDIYIKDRPLDSAYVNHVVLHRAIAIWKEKRHKFSLSIEDISEPYIESMETTVCNNDYALYLLSCVGSDVKKTALVMYSDGNTISEIANATGVSYGCAKSRITSARLRILGVIGKTIDKSTCIMGHRLTPGNVYVNKGTRQCKQCKNTRDRDAKRRKSGTV